MIYFGQKWPPLTQIGAIEASITHHLIMAASLGRGGGRGGCSAPTKVVSLLEQLVSEHSLDSSRKGRVVMEGWGKLF